jgi:prevent-host-death family protein
VRTIGAFEAKTRFSELLREVEAGESFEVRRRNRPVARIVGVEGADRRRETEAMVTRVQALRKTVVVSRAELHDWIREGQR